ncbi:hypothetical protein FRC12_017992 [Ceratobasidium sp. 428]|nr:hypothetical protein FRC12_017992 [Ceratobasidium sp. 428]
MAYPLMPRRAAPILPNEILRLILELLENPSAVSLVSCLFYHLAFPLVHHTLEFASDARTKEFLDRVLSEDDEAPLRISQALRRLTVFEKKSGHDYTCPVDDKLLARFRDVIPKLVNLEQLNWRIPYELDDTDVLIDFQRFCPRLQSLDLTANSQQFVERSKIFEFRNLTHLQAMLRGWDHERTDPNYQNALEVWFKGGHADVGGGTYPPPPEKDRTIMKLLSRPLLSNITLRWMVRECLENSVVLLDPDSMRRYRSAGILEVRDPKKSYDEQQKVVDNLDAIDITPKP